MMGESVRKGLNIKRRPKWIEVMIPSYQYSQFFPNAASHETKNNTSKRYPEPESRSANSSIKWRNASHVHHERYSPTSKGNLNAHINEQKDSTDPNDPAFHNLFGSTIAFASIRMFIAESLAISIPECHNSCTKLDDNGSNYHVHERVPLITCFSDHSRRDERTKNTSEPVRAMKETQNFVGVQ